MMDCCASTSMELYHTPKEPPLRDASPQSLYASIAMRSLFIAAATDLATATKKCNLTLCRSSNSKPVCLDE
jgi:hypothetical protein